MKKIDDVGLETVEYATLEKYDAETGQLLETIFLRNGEIQEIRKEK